MATYIIGTGVMGSAIAKVLAKKGEKVFVYDKNFTKVKSLAKNKNIFVDISFKNLPKADFVILAVKPYHLAEVASDIVGKIKPSAIIVSIVAGIKIAKVQKLFNHKKVLRLMPNLGLSVNEGIAIWKFAGLSDVEKNDAKKMLNLLTENFETKDEKQIDAFTAIAGSGPAYFLFFARALQKAAKNLGFDQAKARLLVEKTFLGAAALQQNGSYDELITQVASKKGTTEAALKVFGQAGLNQIIFKAVKTAQKRAIEISNQ